jgi:hypothetical protein
MELLKVKEKTTPIIKVLRLKGYSYDDITAFFEDCINEVKQKKCTHENARICVDSSIFLIEELYDYCPDCKLKWNYRTEY